MTLSSTDFDATGDEGVGGVVTGDPWQPPIKVSSNIMEMIPININGFFPVAHAFL